MDPLINQNLENREETRAALTHKLEALELRLRESVESVKEAVKRSTDVPYQVNKRPWQMFGLSIAVGCAVGRLLSNGSAESRPGDSRSKARPVSAETGTIRNGDPYPQQLSVIKGATIGAVATILSELARQVIPTFLAQLENYSQNKPMSEPRNRANETA
jgi:hypothetical protein